jgi:hypothetical protein
MDPFTATTLNTHPPLIHYTSYINLTLGQEWIQRELSVGKEVGRAAVEVAGGRLGDLDSVLDPAVWFSVRLFPYGCYMVVSIMDAVQSGLILGGVGDLSLHF